MIPNQITNDFVRQASARVYARAGGLRYKDKQVIASTILRNPEKVFEPAGDQDRFLQAMTGEFKTPEDENMFKECLACVSAMARGRKEILDVDEAYTSKQVKGADTKNMKKAGKIGRYRLFKRDDGQALSEMQQVTV